MLLLSTTITYCLNNVADGIVIIVHCQCCCQIFHYHLPLSLSNPLMTRGRNSKEVRSLRLAFGSNTLHGTDDNDDDNYNNGSIALLDENDDAENIHRSPTTSSFASSATITISIKSYRRKIKAIIINIQPLLQAFIDQLKEPLIGMLLFSAAISYCLNNVADAISISIALAIVSIWSPPYKNIAVNVRSKSSPTWSRTHIVPYCAMDMPEIIISPPRRN